MVRDSGLSFYSRKKKVTSNLFIEILTWIFGVVLSVFLAGVLVYFFGMTTHVVGESMEPTLYNEQTVLIDRLSYIFSAPKSGDVVVFLPNGNEKSHYYVKRVVGTPGDTVQIIDGHLYINEELFAYEDKYDEMAQAGIAENKITLKNGEYFVLGDNRNASEDSRSANIGIINKKNIVGKAWLHLGAGNNTIGFVK
jgi:signal peptidase I